MAVTGFSGNGRGRGRYRPLAEINVTPMVDVMLVLLIIFMVAAPLMTSGVTVDLPKATLNPVNSDSKPLTVSLNAEGRIFLQDAEVDQGDLVARLRAIVEGNPEQRIFVRGDKSLPYGRIIEVMGIITQGGFAKVALLSEQAGAGARPPAARPGQPAAAQSATPQSATPQPAVPQPAPRRQGNG